MTPAQVAALLRAQINASIVSSSNNIVLKDSQTLALLNRAVAPLALTGTANIDAALRRVEAEIWNFIEAEYLEKDLITESILESLEQLAVIKDASPSAVSGGSGPAVNAFQSLPFSNPLSVSFSHQYTHYPTHTITGPLSFSANGTGAVSGSTAYVMLVANGVNVPTFNGITVLDGLAYDNRIGAQNILQFTSLGAPGNLTYYVSFLRSINNAPVVIRDLFSTRTSLVVDTGTAYQTTGNNAGYSQRMLSDKVLLNNANGSVTIPSSAVASAIIGLDSVNALSTFTANDYYAWCTAGEIYSASNGSAPTSRGTIGSGDFRVKRTNGVITLESRPTNGTWSILYTWPTNTNASLFASIYFPEPPTTINPILEGFT